DPEPRSAAMNAFDRIRRLGPLGRRDRLAVAVVATILGLLVVGQLRGQAGVPGLSNLTTQELTLVIANLNARNDELRNEVAALEQSTSTSQTTVDQLKADLARIRAWSGVTGLQGQGVEIQVSGPIGGDAIEDLLNEVGNAGAEAIAVGGVRVVPGTVVAGQP